MKDVTFMPYVGLAYRTQAVRLMILGESHYGEPDENPAEATRTVVAMWRSRYWAVRYLTVAARILTGQPAWAIDRSSALDGVAFYNFIQVSMPTVRVRPTAEQARASWAPFRQVVAACDPTHIVATGRRFLWDNMPPPDGGSGEAAFAGETLPWREYLSTGRRVPAVAIPHLSRASAPRWRGPVTAFLEGDGTMVREA